MNILVLGGTGVLSTDIVDKYVSEGHDVYLITRGSNPIPDRPNIHSIIGNVRNLDSIYDTVSSLRYDLVLDFLSITKANLEYSFTKLAGLCENYVFISSACVFRRSMVDGIITEESPKPNSLLQYSINKYACEKYLQEEIGNSSTCWTIVRPYITYGETRIPVGIAPLAGYHWTIAGRILANKPFFLWDDGSNKCTLYHTKDFARTFYGMFGGGNFHAFEDYNLVGDSVTTWNDVLKTLYKLLGKEPNIIYIPTSELEKLLPEHSDYILGDRSLDAVFDNSKLKHACKEYCQSISLEEGIKRTIDHYKSHGYLKGIDYRYDARIDRALARFLPFNDHRRRKLKFVDYLGNATVRDYIVYTIYRYLPLQFARGLIKVIGKIKLSK